ncbi:MAG: FMN reductase [Pelagibacteraceae bacterium]|nr:FMN reductase [Pelagibacteraceae bacterium]
MDRFNYNAKKNMKKINSKIFKKALSMFPTGITIIGINEKNNYIGKTINSFSALSLSPPLILFSLNKKSSSLNSYKKSNFFSVNILSKKQKKMSVIFAKKNVKSNKKFFELGYLNTPIIKNSIVNLECKKTKLISQGDHIIFICEVVFVKYKNNTDPLIYFKSKYF